MKSIVLLFLIFFNFCAHTQVTFEVSNSSSLNGVYSIKLPSLNWNTQDLRLPGNWVKDTVVLSNDGVLGSACNPILSSISGNTAIAYRSGCSMKDALLNIQNAGATCAVIIDTINGRPLDFSNEVVDPSIIIPFVLISKSIGEEIVLELQSSDSLILSFGNKSGINQFDLGIYKERALWPSYGTFPFQYLTYVDSIWGCWVYNRGSQDVNNVVLNQRVETITSIDTNTLFRSSTPFNLTAFDSVWVAMDSLFVISGEWISQLNFSYELVLANDEDTLDNFIEEYIVGSINSGFFSPIHIVDPLQLSDLDIDYVFEDTDFYYSKFQTYFLQGNQSYPMGNFLFKGVTLCDNTQDDNIFAFGDLSSSTQVNLDSLNAVLIPNMGDIGICSNNQINNYYSNCIHSLPLAQQFGTKAQVFLNLGQGYGSTGVVSISFDTKMYHDLRKEKDSLFVNYFYSNGAHIELPMEVTQVDCIQVLTPHQCNLSIDENELDSIEIKPNPFDTWLNISGSVEISELSILTINGKEVFNKKEINDKSIRLDLNHLKKSVYFVRITDINGRISIKKVIK